jgi:hypothetical protein
MFAGTVKAESSHSTSQMPDGTRCNFRILIFCEYFDSIFALPVRRSTEKERRVGNEPTYRLFFEAISDAHRCFRFWEQTFGGDARQLLQSKAFSCAYVFLSSNVSLSPALTRQDTVLPISASFYSKPLGNAMRALRSSPVAGLLVGSTLDSAILGIRIVADRFSRSTVRVIGAKSVSIRLGLIAALVYPLVGVL